ncbi:MAG: HD domain-containing protein, partial [Streptosporangiaceae bacterium]
MRGARVAGDVVTTGTRAADTARVDAPQGTDPVADAEQTEATAAAVPSRRAAEEAPPAPAGDPAPPASQEAAAAQGQENSAAQGQEDKAAQGQKDKAAQSQEDQAARPSPARSSQARPSQPRSSQPRPGRARAAVAAVQGQAADVAASGVGVRRRLARLGAQRSGGVSPVLDPLVKTVRSTHPKADIRLIERAYETAAYWHRDQKRLSGDPYITHPLAVATILAELGMNTETICAALLHDTVEDTPYSLTELRGEFGEDITALVDGVTKLDKVKYGESAEAETVRKMVVAMSRDIRVLVIKLADRLHNMRTLRYLKREKQERKSREVLEIYAPLAHRLGMNKVKWELEDLAFQT